MSLDSALRKAMGGVRPSGDLLRPNKRPRFSDVSKSAFPSLQQLQGVQDSGGTINLQSNSTLTLRFMPKVERRGVQWTQGTFIFQLQEGKDQERRFRDLHSVNDFLLKRKYALAKEPSELSDDEREDILLAVRQECNFIGVFRNIMPDSLRTRQPVIGVDVFGRTNVQDLSNEHATVGDSLHLALVSVDNTDGGHTFQFIPCLNRTFKGREPHAQIKTGLCNGTCGGLNVLTYMLVGTISHRPGRPKRRNRRTAWMHGRREEAQAMNLVEVILA